MHVVKNVVEDVVNSDLRSLKMVVNVVKLMKARDEAENPQCPRQVCENLPLSIWPPYRIAIVLLLYSSP